MQKNIISLFLVIAVFILVAFCCCQRPQDSVTKTDNKTSINGNNNQSKTSSPAPNVSTNSTPPLPSNLSAKENLEAGKKAFDNEDFSTAKNYLSAIPKNSQEYAAAKNLLAKLEKKQQQAEITAELNKVIREQAAVEEMLDKTEDFSEEGTLKKSIYLNALKRKGELQIKRLELERKLKKLPQ